MTPALKTQIELLESIVRLGDSTAKQRAELAKLKRRARKEKKL